MERARRKLLAVRARLEEMTECHKRLMALRREATAARHRERGRRRAMSAGINRVRGWR